MKRLLTSTAAIAALALLATGCGSTKTITKTVTKASAPPASTSSAPGDTASKADAQTVTMNIVGHKMGMLASDGLTHDTTYGANFYSGVGKKTTVIVYNYDEGPHTITAPDIKLDQQIPGATDEANGIPSKTTFTLVINKAGQFRWYCTLPCDKGQKYFAMKASKNGPGQDDLMAGYVIAA